MKRGRDDRSQDRPVTYDPYLKRSYYLDQRGVKQPYTPGGGGGGGGSPTGSAGGDLGGTYPNPTVTRARGLRSSDGTTFPLGVLADNEILITSGGDIVTETLANLLAALGIVAPEVTEYLDGSDNWVTHTIPDEHNNVTLFAVQGGGGGGNGRNETSGARNGGGGGGSGATVVWTGPAPSTRELEIFRGAAAVAVGNSQMWRVAFGAQSTNQEYEVIRSGASNIGFGSSATTGSPGAGGASGSVYTFSGRYSKLGNGIATAGTAGAAGGTGGLTGNAITPSATYMRTGGSGGGGVTSGGTENPGGAVNSSGVMPGAAGGTAGGGAGNVGQDIDNWTSQGATGGGGSASGTGGAGGAGTAVGCGGGGGAGGTGAAGTGASGGIGGPGRLIVITY